MCSEIYRKMIKFSRLNFMKLQTLLLVFTYYKRGILMFKGAVKVKGVKQILVSKLDRYMFLF